MRDNPPEYVRFLCVTLQVVFIGILGAFPLSLRGQETSIVSDVRRPPVRFIAQFDDLSGSNSISPGSTIPVARIPSRPESRKTQLGIDVLESQSCSALRGKHVGLITNQTGVDSAGHRTIDVLAQAKDVTLVALFSPEHGIEGRLDGAVPETRDSATGIVIYSLYGQTRRPTAEMLQRIDALVFDIQDAGVRFYTYITTMAYAMEEAAKHHIAFYVLDRPNPLGGKRIQGPLLDSDRLSFTGYFQMPVLYGMTMGELAKMFNAENKIGADLHVVAMRNWHRREMFDATGLAWIPPSPNLPTFMSDLLYPGVEILQAGGISVGRGTDTPFEIFGAPWIDANQLLAELNRRAIPGVEFAPARFTPRTDIYKDVPCEGVRLSIENRTSFDPMLTGLEIASGLWKLYPSHFEIEKIVNLLGSKKAIEQLKAGDAPAHIVDSEKRQIESFRRMRAKYLIYE